MSIRSCAEDPNDEETCLSKYLVLSASKGAH